MTRNKWRGVIRITWSGLHDARLPFHITRSNAGRFQIGEQPAVAGPRLAGPVVGASAADVALDRGLWKARGAEAAYHQGRPSGPPAGPPWLSHFSCSEGTTGLCFSLADGLPEARSFLLSLLSLPAERGKAQ